jgi:hypothetical protein
VPSPVTSSIASLQTGNTVVNYPAGMPDEVVIEPSWIAG